MRVSCSGCRVLRKGCGEDCTIRPCLQWIETPESQANATVFLAKYYGRAGLQNLLNAGPDNLRPAIFRSLLYEACGRIVNPIYGSAGLLWSGNWNLCQAAVEAVLSGAPIVQVSPESAAGGVSPPLQAGDIRHVFKEEASGSEASRDLHKGKSVTKYKRTEASGSKTQAEAESLMDEAAAQVIWSWSNKFGSTSHELAVLSYEAEKWESAGESASGETVEASLMMEEQGRGNGDIVELELTLGMEPVVKEETMMNEEDEMMMDGGEEATCGIQLALNFSA